MQTLHTIIRQYQTQLHRRFKRSQNTKKTSQSTQTLSLQSEEIRPQSDKIIRKNLQ